MKKISLWLLASLLLLSCKFINASPLIDEIAEQYVQLVLATGEHDASYVDAYYGPKEWKQHAEQNKISVENIQVAAKLVKSSLDMAAVKTEEKARKKYLTTQLSSLIARLDMLKGKRMTFDEQSKALYDTVAPHYPMEKFDKVLAKLDKLLPGSGSLMARSIAFKKQFEIPADKLDAVFAESIKACREKTLAKINLPANESFKLEYVTGKPWSGYNWYQGKAHSLIQVNTEFPVPISRAIDLGCHEGYPGHHTYNALLEENLVNKKGWIEFSVYPLFSPQSLIAEGSANYGIDLAFPAKDKLYFEQAKLYPLAGIDPKLAADYELFQRLMAELSYVGNELARQFIDGKIDESQAIALIQKYSLVDQKKATQRISFWKTYGAYVINYNWGKELVKRWVEKDSKNEDDKWTRFTALLSSPRLPSDLEQSQD